MLVHRSLLRIAGPLVGLIAALTVVLVGTSAASAAGPLTYSMSPTGPTRVTLHRDGGYLQVVDDSGAILAARAIADTSNVSVTGSNAADDTLTVDLSGGAFAVPTHFEGGAGGFDTLALGGGAVTRSQHTATGPQAGTIRLDDLRIDYGGIEPVNDTVPATNFTFTAPAGAPRINVVDGPNVSGFDTLQINDDGTGSFELINFANKQNVTINGGPSSAFVLNPSRSAAGLATLALNGASGANSFSIRSTTVPTAVTGGPDDDTMLLSGDRAGAAPTLDGGDGADRYFVAFGNLPEPATINDTGSGVDQLSVVCGPPTTVTANSVSSGSESVAFSGIEVPPAACPANGAQGPAGPAGPTGPRGARGPVALVIALVSPRLKTVRGSKLSVDYLSTAPATATLDVLKGRTRVARIKGAAKLGRNRLRWNGKAGTKLAAPGTYKLVLRLATPDGQKATDRGRVTVRR